MVKHVARACLLILLIVLVFQVRGVSAESVTGCQVPSQYATIQSAIDDGCHDIAVAAGRYVEHLTIPAFAGSGIAPALTLRGTGTYAYNTVLDGEAADRLLTVGRGRHIVIENLQIEDGYTFEDGGAILMQDSGILETSNVRIFDNYSLHQGSAIALIGDAQEPAELRAILTNDTRIAGNHALTGSSIYIKGTQASSLTIQDGFVNGNHGQDGAIFTDDVDVYIYGTHFLSNNSASCGGALTLLERGATGIEHQFHIYGVRFAFNSARTGGAICVQGGDLIIGQREHNGVTRGTIFDQNSAELHGGAIYSGRSSITTRNAIFTHNEAETGGGVHLGLYSQASFIDTQFRHHDASEGGGIYATRSTIYMSGASGFDSDFASKNGGALWLGYEGIANITSGYIHANTARGSGGAIALMSDSAELTVSDSLIDHNFAQDDGGAIYLYAGSATLDNVHLESNQAYEGDGGALYSMGNVTLTDSRINNNFALLGGGLMFNQGQFTIDRVGILGNNATYYGGGLFTNFPSTVSSIEDFSISGNTAQNGGGIYVYSEEVQGPAPRLNIARGLISENTATGSGGGIDGNVNLNQTAVISNTANDSGGGIRTNDSRFINVTISNNSAGVVGSGLVADGLLASYTTIANNVGSAAIFNPTDGAIPVQFEHTIIDNPDVQNCAGESVQAIGVNTIDSDGSCNFYNSRSLSGVDPMLEPLAMNGGSTPTHALRDGSPAIGAGYDCPESDQRGGTRPAGSCDLGAFQTNAAIPTAVGLTAQGVEIGRTSTLILLAGLMLSMLTVTLRWYRPK